MHTSTSTSQLHPGYIPQFASQLSKISKHGSLKQAEHDCSKNKSVQEMSATPVPSQEPIPCGALDALTQFPFPLTPQMEVGNATIS